MTLPTVSVCIGLVIRMNALKLFLVLLAYAKFIAPISIANIAMTKKNPNLLTLSSQNCLELHQYLASNVMGISA